MKTTHWPLRAFLLFTLVQLVSCTKNIEPANNEALTLETSSDASLASEFPNCKLRRVVYENPFVSESTVNMLFSYNSAGNPHSLVHTGPLVVPTSGYNTQNYYFYYDKKNRLRELLVNFTEDGRDEYTELHRYGYNENDVIITDTVLRPDWENNPTNFLPYKFINITYDAQGRIAKENIRDLYWGTITNPTYTYDARGNLAVKGWKSSGYDNKVSIFRAHPLFQFIHRNYSKNNALPEAKYNSLGLPNAVRNLNDEFFGAYKTNPAAPANPLGGIIKAVYDCQ